MNPPPAPSPLVVDIETVPVDWDDLDPAVQDYLLRRANTAEEKQAVRDRTALHPGTGRIVAIGLWRPDEDRGGVLLEGSREIGWTPFYSGVAAAAEDDPAAGAMVYRGPEARILTEFWRYVKNNAGTIITFNGRTFDGPFLMLRSSLLGVEPTRNLVPYRYSFKEHCDLAEVLTFFGARRMDAFDFWCRQYGIASPKSAMDGSGVAQAYKEGRLDDIGRYCLADVRATAELYRRLVPLIRLVDKD